eukprot:96873_1
MTSIFLISFINIILCISFILIGIGKWYTYKINFVLTFLLISPQWLYFVVFSVVLYSWILVASSFVGSSESMPNLLSKYLVIANLFMIIFGFIDYLIISIVNVSSNMLWIYSLSQFVWIVLLFISSIIFTIFGYKTQNIVRTTAETIQNLQKIENANMKKEIALANKLLFVTINITIFFLIQCILLIYFVISKDFNNKSILEWRIIDLLSHFICLCLICYLYKNTL